MNTETTKPRVDLDGTTALCLASPRDHVLLTSPPDLNAGFLALASGVAIAAGHRSGSAYCKGWTGPVAVVSGTQTGKALRANAKKLAAIFGDAQESALALVGSDELSARGLASPAERQPWAMPFDSECRALGVLVKDTGAKLVILDFPEAFGMTLSMALSLTVCPESVATLAVTRDTLDRLGQSVFTVELKLDRDGAGLPILRYMRPGTGHGRPLTLPGLVS